MQELGFIYYPASKPDYILGTVKSTNTFDGKFSATITGLAPNTRYLIRAYVFYTTDTAYSNSSILYTNPPYFRAVSGVVDIDGNFYKTIIINGREWMQ